MKPLLDPAVPLGPAAATRQDDVPTRVRMVLGTRPGQLPWRPTFGCDLDRFVGQPLTTSRLEEMAEVVRDAVARHMPEVDVIDCGVRVETRWGAPSDAERRAVPIGEAALVRFGVQAALQIELQLQTESGPIAIQATIDG
ncbi:MAG: Baseplate wedge protein gp25 [Pseudomonadota bacterium]|jgi:phage baseplate assembly protein W